MKELEDRIRNEGIVRKGVLKVGSFLNHQCDIDLFERMGAEWARLFAGVPVDKILTIEASGIGIACITATHFGNVPVVFAKKNPSLNLDGDEYHVEIHSFTKDRDFDVIVSKEFLHRGEHVLIIDDFLANGAATEGLIEICDQAGAEVVGVGVAIEKGFEPGGACLRDRGYNVQSLAIVSAMDPETGAIEFA
jgi:xanthine phosphoribosyltransferase